MAMRNKGATSKSRVAVLTADTAFEQSVRATFDTGNQFELHLINGTPASIDHHLDSEASVLVIDLDASRDHELLALQRMMARINGWPPVVVIAQSFDKDVARQLLQLRVADFLVKPIQPVELLRACTRAVQAPTGAEQDEAEIYTFLAVGGGAGVTTLAIQTALLLLGNDPKQRPPTCLVDLDFQHGTCADYLDIEPRLDLNEIEPHPERLDRQLLEVMLSHHASGLAVIAAPNRPAEMRSFDPDMVTRLLDLVSSHFKYVVIDMPRTWFSWTDSVLLGSNRLFVVSEMTVPGVKHAKQLITAIRERLGDGPRPQVIINRFEQPMFGPGLRRTDIVQAIGDDLFATIPNNYRLVREAIDRGVPLDEVKANNNISSQLKKLLIQQSHHKSAAAPTSVASRKLSLSWVK
jgi:pilus assembly protein CpaE